jgi:integrase
MVRSVVKLSRKMLQFILVVDKPFSRLSPQLFADLLPFPFPSDRTSRLEGFSSRTRPCFLASVPLPVELSTEGLIRRFSPHPENKLRPATVNRKVACLKTMLSHAVRHKKLDKNPFLSVRRLAENNVRMRILNDQAFEPLVDACPEYLRPVVQAAFYSGMRKSEIIFPTWGEVDPSRGFIRLKGDRTKDGSARSEVDPSVKTKNSHF